MEALKQRIAESARKAGLDNEFDTLEKAIRVRSSPSCYKFTSSTKLMEVRFLIIQSSSLSANRLL